jgi:hypothetical protein
LVVAFAHAGYTSADPNASEAERFAAGVDAFVRLLAVGGEWASYASLIPGRGGARAAASEASEQLAKRAARELPPVVIGENMERVTAYARRIGAETIDDWLGGRPWSEELNKEWILQMMREGRRVIDIGPDFPRRLKRHLARLRGENAPHPVSSPYSLERCLLKQYQYLHYEKRFTREGKWWGKEY